LRYFHNLWKNLFPNLGKYWNHLGTVRLIQGCIKRPVPRDQEAELFPTSKQTISLHIINILKEKELDVDSVVKHYLTTASDGKQYEYMIIFTNSCAP